MTTDNLYPNNIHDIDSALIFLAAGAAMALVTQLLTYLGRRIVKWADKKNQYKELCWELNYNLANIIKNLELLHELEKVVLADQIDGYFNFFTLEMVITTTLQEMIKERSLQKVLNPKEIEGLHWFIRTFSSNSQGQLHGRLNYYHDNYRTQPTLKSIFLKELGIWRSQLVLCKNATESTLKKVSELCNYQNK